MELKHQIKRKSINFIDVWKMFSLGKVYEEIQRPYSYCKQFIILDSIMITNEILYIKLTYIL